MVVSRTCRARNARGDSCRAAPLPDQDYCVFHDPEYGDTVQETRRAGGQRRRREVTLATADDFQGLTSVPQIRRPVEVAAFDAPGLENSISRVRALAYLAQVTATLLDKGELEERLDAMEAAIGTRARPKDSRRS
jgi:hypothetical protein